MINLKINEVAKLTGVTVRTLHYYDEIGLLKPSKVTDAGYRIYDEKAMETLQQILFFRELEFPLNEIKGIMSNPNYNREDTLLKHRELLTQKRNRLDKLISLLEKNIKGDRKMSFKEFDTTEIEENKKKYADEAKCRWGETDAYNESQKKTSAYGEKEWKLISTEQNDILKEFGDCRHLDAGCDEVQNLVKRWQNHITNSFYDCTKEILSGLGLMYVNDERFMANIDKNGKGTAAFLSKAIEIYCK